MAKQKQDDQPELTYSSYVRTRDVTLKNCRRRWMIGRSGERWSGISVLAARHDDDDDIYQKMMTMKNIFDTFFFIPKVTHIYGRAKAGRLARTYIQQLCEDTGCSPEDLPEAMNDREKWRERARDIRPSSTTWWWWWYIYIVHVVYPCSSMDAFWKNFRFI